MALQIPVDSDILAAFAFYATIVLVKTMLMSPLTAVMRFKKMSFANEEDAAGAGSNAKVSYVDNDVERYRRCHQNDLENVFPFVLIGLFYVLTEPTAAVAVWHFRIFAVSRIVHTVAYLNKIGPPRSLGFAAGLASTISMAVQILLAVY